MSCKNTVAKAFVTVFMYMSKIGSRNKVKLYQEFITVRYRIIGASMSEPHTSVFKCVIYYYSVVRRSVNQRTLF